MLRLVCAGSRSSVLPDAMRARTGETSTSDSRSTSTSGRVSPAAIVLGTAIVAAGLTALLLVFHVTGEPSAWYLAGPLLAVGLGHGLIVAPNIDLVLRSVPASDNGSASGVLNTAQRIGSALGIAVVGTVLFGTLHPAGDSGPALAAAFSHSFQAALVVNIALSVGTFALALVTPGTRASQRS
jgi:sugar phosphate permease